MTKDILLDNNFQLVPRSNGDATLIEGVSCFLQTLRLEAASCEGDLWYAPAWGWSLLDFKNRRQDELALLEMEQRVRQKLAAHTEIAVESIQISVCWAEDGITISVAFRMHSSDDLIRFNLRVGRTEIEVIPLA